MFDSSMFDSIHSYDSALGGGDLSDLTSHGMIHSDPNVFGGQDFSDSMGNDLMHSHPNVFGGMDMDPLTSFNPSFIPDFTF